MVLGESEACPPENFENLDTVITTLVRFEQQILFKFLAANSQFFTEYVRFVPAFSIYTCLTRNVIVITEVQNYEKLCFIQK